MDDQFGRACTIGSVAVPTSAATIAARRRLLLRRPRICVEIHSSTSMLTPTERVGAQLSIAVSGESATARGGTGRPEAAAA